MLVQEIGKAVASARSRLGISLDELAEKTLLDVGLLELIERGERLVSTAKLDRIASALGIDAFALYAGKEVEHSLVVLPRHAARSDFQHQDLVVLRRAFERAVAMHELARTLGKKNSIEDFSPQSPGQSPSEDGYHCARRVRKELGNITEPLEYELSRVFVEVFDIPVIAESLATNALLAVMVRAAHNRASAIVLNRAVRPGPLPYTKQSWLVDRVSMCHELCHILFDEPKGGLVDVVLDDIEQGKTPIEQRANAFAAEMLIPLHGLKKILGEGTQIATPDNAEKMVNDVRKHFNTPIEIAVNHLYNYGYIAKVSTFREDLIRGMRVREFNEPPEKVVNDDEIWRLVLRLRTQEAQEKSLITDGMARALLEMGPGEPLPWERDQV